MYICTCGCVNLVTPHHLKAFTKHNEKREQIIPQDKIHTQPHVHMYMFCPYVISTLYWFTHQG
jgi:hypothetical protein